MKLPHLTAKIGKEAKNEIGGNTELAMLVEDINFSSKDNQKGKYIIHMTFDIPKKEIRFENSKKFNQSSIFNYNYFGNNSAAALQYYLTRSGDNIHYLLTSVFNDLNLALIKNEMQNTELKIILNELEQNELIKVGDKKGEGYVNLSCFSEIEEGVVDKKKKSINFGQNSLKGEEFIRYLTDASKNDKFVLVIPQVKREEEEPPIILSNHRDYILLVKKEEQLENVQSSKEKKLCYLCHDNRTDTSSSLTSKFSRSGINKIFTTTTYNAAKNLNKKAFDDNYSICGDCFKDLLFGEKKVSNSFSGYIAGERAFIIPESLINDLDYNLEGIKIKKDTDFFFDHYEYENFEYSLNYISEELGLTAQVIHFIVYRTDGNSVDILETIEDVPTTNFVELIKALGEISSTFVPFINPMKLGTIYRMIPVRKDNKNNQLDIQRILGMYKALLKGHSIETISIFDLAVEAMDKGIKELNKSQIRQYFNLDFAGNKLDFFIMKLIMRYLALLKTCEHLEIIDKKSFQRRGVQDLQIKTNDSRLNEMESFLDKKKFDRVPRAMFYLGTVMYLVASAQYNKNHKSKPIMKKVSYQGMSHKEMIWLYQELLEKCRQYDLYSSSKNSLSEKLLSAFHNYTGVNETEELTEQENVFYLMAGYAYMVGDSFINTLEEKE
ncbi:TM1802 family CRISPR-associated protein [Natranaerofaba carboxydovora]|uniref:TM1802 family CRISPR-associated protein n=1 Tax=Natranaerofaba carboxydovora TaxID=2742683 RepID=UPI001F12E979|nr:TM1802 family CRISPR-associated protein [Natranaerofaba carboxydovora]UMZ72705.1 CRISPR-associated protein (cas_TM1802) [Natranaerofaba carboxydovora]